MDLSPVALSTEDREFQRQLLGFLEGVVTEKVVRRDRESGENLDETVYLALGEAGYLAADFVSEADAGFSAVQPIRTVDGDRTNITCSTDVRVDDGYRIGEVNGGWGGAAAAPTGIYGGTLEVFRNMIAAHALGLPRPDFAARRAVR